jgi:hypothetical protein
MSYKGEFYDTVASFTVEELKKFFEAETYTFNEFYEDYKNFNLEEERYKRKLLRIRERKDKKAS